MIYTKRPFLVWYKCRFLSGFCNNTNGQVKNRRLPYSKRPFALFAPMQMKTFLRSILGTGPHRFQRSAEVAGKSVPPRSAQVGGKSVPPRWAEVWGKSVPATASGDSRSAISTAAGTAVNMAIEVLVAAFDEHDIEAYSPSPEHWLRFSSRFRTHWIQHMMGPLVQKLFQNCLQFGS